MKTVETQSAATLTVTMLFVFVVRKRARWGDIRAVLGAQAIQCTTQSPIGLGHLNGG